MHTTGRDGSASASPIAPAIPEPMLPEVELDVEGVGRCRGEVVQREQHVLADVGDEARARPDGALEVGQRGGAGGPACAQSSSGSGTSKGDAERAAASASRACSFTSPRPVTSA